MREELPKHYDFTAAQGQIYERWLKSGAMDAVPDEREDRYVIMMPLPNVTGALHMGHAMDNMMQDLLIRWHRMLGDNTLWMPGADHAGIATQAVVEKRLFELEGKTRHDIGREALVERIWAWKDEFLTRIVSQQQSMGCSCDWNLSRFTMDAVCTRAVREAFYRLFRDGLIFRGFRLVNWDCQLQTAISDDEIVHETVQGHFWNIRYPVVDPKPGEPTHLTVATTRPETMLGDTAVAVHPDPEGALRRIIGETKKRIEKASRRERSELEAGLTQMEKRVESHLPGLLRLLEMAKDGRRVLLPLLNREIPLILDEWAKPELGSGCVKITPAHDANDYDVWTRHSEEIGIINLLDPDGTYNENAGPYAGLKIMDVRRRVVEDLEAGDLLESIEDREVEIGHSDRSKSPIEPYLSKQWFIHMGDIDGGLLFGRETAKDFRAPGLAQAAMDAVRPDWKSPTGRNLTFYPDSERYAGTYWSWLSEKRDWCISRQLWWGHRIPIWHGSITFNQLENVDTLVGNAVKDTLWSWVADDEGNLTSLKDAAVSISNLSSISLYKQSFDVLVCIRQKELEDEFGPLLEKLGLSRDPDVLDTWFSSALWPFSTLGWPDPDSAVAGRENRPLGAKNGNDHFLDFYYPGSCLVTGRDIITQWVARMLVMGLYLLGDVPFTDCFIHANIQDGKGERMSKSKGNGIDPIDIIEEYGADAMRYVLSDMQTGTQDIRLPVQAVSPFTGERVDLATASHGQTIFTYICPGSGKEFDILGTMESLPRAKITSDRFDMGRAFCTKLWNAARFALMNLGQYEYRPISPSGLEPEDLWILSRLSAAIAGVTRQLYAYNPSAAIGTAREFFWSELCDWYLELIKPRLRAGKKDFEARTVLAVAVDQVLRLFHPFVPFITETLWEKLNAQAPRRGLDEELESSAVLISAKWPGPWKSYEDGKREEEFDLLRKVIRSIRDLRARYNVPPGKRIEALIKVKGATAESIHDHGHLIMNMTALERLEVGEDVLRPALSALQVEGDMEIYLLGAIDREKERTKLEKQKEKLAGDLAKTEKKLTNSNFVEKAPAQVVEGERKRLAELRSQLELVEQNLTALS